MNVYLVMIEGKDTLTEPEGVYEDEDDAYKACRDFVIEEIDSIFGDDDRSNKTEHFLAAYAKDRNVALDDWVRENVHEDISASVETWSLIPKSTEKKLDESVDQIPPRQ